MGVRAARRRGDSRIAPTSTHRVPAIAGMAMTYSEVPKVKLYTRDGNHVALSLPKGLESFPKPGYGPKVGLWEGV